MAKLSGSVHAFFIHTLRRMIETAISVIPYVVEINIRMVVQLYWVILEYNFADHLEHLSTGICIYILS